MPSIITLAHQKGGVGKSTIALNLYGYFSQSGLRTALVDIDPQGSISSFVDFAGADRFDLVRRKDFATYADLLAQVQGFEVVIIDTPPYLSKELEEIIKITDLVIIPCKASLFDAFAIRQTIDFIETQRTDKNDFLSAIVMTMAISGASLQAQIRDHLEQHKIPILKTEIGNRVAYAKSLLLSGNVMQDDSGKAKEEMQNLADEILTLLSNK
ncbi:ParA family protein [Massilia genomosp. 1]|uniref:AAA family ATPase n=1 Tax=Massilia genomosp. 1 TaxID=2609280 RepID=A0ABX0MV44_9BURK|nr:ParA family protein [Massilia genomosp. 1]NHZ66629.1 AAA family ATPase [Massilia genomosp. 1]